MTITVKDMVPMANCLGCGKAFKREALANVACSEKCYTAATLKDVRAYHLETIRRQEWELGDDGWTFIGGEP